MIKVRNKILFIPESELSIAAAGDANSVTREFHIDRLQPDGIDLANLHFRLDIRYTDTDTLDHTLLDPTVTDDRIALLWTVQKDNTAHPGSMFVNIRAFNDDGLVRWSSFQGAFYVEQTVGGGEAAASQLSELEQLEKRYDETAKKLSADMASLKNMERTATSYAVGGVLNDDGSPFREGQDEDNAKFYAEKSAESASASAGSAEASAGSEAESAAHAAESLRHAEDSGRSAENSALSAAGAKEFAGNAAASATESAGHASKSEEAATRSSASAAAAASSAAESKKYAEASRASADEAASSAKASKNSEISAAASADRADKLINTNGLATIYIDKKGHMIYEAANGALLDFEIRDHKNLEVAYG